MIASFLLPKLIRRDGQLAKIADILSTLPMEEAFRVELHEQRPTRSHAQNRLLWGWIYPEIVRQGGESLGGWEAEDLHEYFLGEHFGWQRSVALGRTRMRPLRRSSKLSKAEFSDFVAFIQRRMAEHGIVIADTHNGDL